MIFEVVQTAPKPYFAFNIPTIGSTNGPLVHLDGDSYNIEFDPVKRFIRTHSLKDALTFYVYNQDSLVGKMVGDQKTTKRKMFGIIPTAIEVTKVEWENVEYSCYEVGMGKDGTYHTLWTRDNIQVAAIREDPVVDNGCFRFTVYTDHPELSHLLALLSIYYAFLKSDPLEDGIGVKSSTVKITKIPELLAKYNPDYIAQILKKG